MAEKYGIERLDHNDDDIVAQIHGVFQRSYRIEGALVGASDLIFPPLQRTRLDLKSAATHFFGHWEDGVLTAVVELDKSDLPTLFHICSLVVDPAYFRRGIASRLLRRTLAGVDWQTVVVETAAANEPAIALYLKFGFIEEKRYLAEGDILKAAFRKQAKPGPEGVVALTKSAAVFVPSI